MIRSLLRLGRDESGQTLAIIAVMIAGVMGMVALTIDLGLLIGARREAQRAADAAALAGAKEFLLKTPAAAAVPHAYDSAMAYATRNYIHDVYIDTSEVTVQVIPAEQKVWVRIERTGIGLWFATIFGRGFGTVNAAAAAAAMPAGAANCVAPFALPDAWGDADDDTNGNRMWDGLEHWEFDTGAGDQYRRYQNNPAATPAETGYGSAYRNGNGMGINYDYGLPMRVKFQDPGQAPIEGFFYPFRIGSNTGANTYRSAISGCDTQVVPLGVPIDVEDGNKKGPTKFGVEDAIAKDSLAYWDPTTNTVIGSTYGSGWLRSPRVKIVPLFSPDQIATIRGQFSGGGHADVIFHDFALMWLEGIVSTGQGATSNEYVQARFLYYASGIGSPGPVTGTLVRVLQLVE